jgi:hypothetical protein
VVLNNLNLVLPCGHNLDTFHVGELKVPPQYNVRRESSAPFLAATRSRGTVFYEREQQPV